MRDSINESMIQVVAMVHVRGVLSLRMRHRILVEVPAALEYLHKNCPQCVLHRDIKSSNVMLDADMKAHLGDFGPP